MPSESDRNVTAPVALNGSCAGVGAVNAVRSGINVLIEALSALTRAAIAVCNVLAAIGTNAAPRAVSAPMPYVLAMPVAIALASAISDWTRARSAHTGSVVDP